jgi:3-hydroxybutyryl-CoA dehydrogenase
VRRRRACSLPRRLGALRRAEAPRCRVAAEKPRRSTRHNARKSDRPEGRAMHTIERVGVVGAGTMGNGIAQACATAGIPVVMVDIAQPAIDRGLAAIRTSLERLEKKDKITADARTAAVARIHGTTDYAQLASAGLIIEAATENLELKLKILKQIEALSTSGTVLASNTSSISITQLAATVSHPERFLGIHFFNPVPLMALVELIRGLQTSDATVEAVQAFVARLSKTPIVVKNSPGFVVNRILCPMLNEAIFALQEGLASADDIDNGMRLGCNHPIGPLALADMIGLDVLLAVMNVFYADFNDPKYRAAPLLKEMVAAGYLGRKTKRGFYRYDA